MSGLTQMMISSDWVENIVGKGENAGYQHFVLFPQCFQKPSWYIETQNCVSRVKLFKSNSASNSICNCVGKQPVAWKEYCAEFW